MFSASETSLNTAELGARKNGPETIAVATSCFPFDGIIAATLFHSRFG
jgi:hypothetical protein